MTDWEPSPHQAQAWAEAQQRIRTECERDIAKAEQGEYVDPLRLAHARQFLRFNREVMRTEGVASTDS